MRCVVTDELDGFIGRECAHRRFWYTQWGEFSADVGAAGAVARFGGHEDGPCVDVVEDTRDFQW